MYNDQAIYDYADEIEIDIIDMLKKIIKKWPVIIASMFICMIIAGVLFTVSNNSIDVSNDEKPIVTIDMLETEMDNDELDMVNNIIELEDKYRKCIENTNKYIGNATDGFSEEGYYNIATINEIATLISSGKSTFNENQRLYYQILTDGEISDNANTDTDNDGNIVKYFIIGAFIGLVIPCVCVALSYILSKKLRVAGDLENPYGLFSLGTINNKNDISSELSKIEDRVLFALDNIKNDGVLFIVPGTDYANKIYVELNRTLKEKDIHVYRAEAGFAETGDEKNARNAGAVVLIEQVSYSTYNNIEQEIQICKKYSLSLIGSISIE